MPRLDLDQYSKEIIHKLRSQAKNKKLPMVKSSLILEMEARERQELSFTNRYSVQDHTFTHASVGTIHLTSPVPRTVPLPSRYAESRSVLLLRRPENRGFRPISSLLHFTQLRLPPALIPKLGLLVPQHPYSSTHSYDFMQACKTGNTPQVSLFLQKNRWLALEFDSGRQTALHWVCKRAYVEIIPLLLSAGAYINARDSEGRTPLHIATRKGHIETVKTLLIHHANPWIRTNSHRTPLQFTSSPVLRKLLTRSSVLFLTGKYVGSATERERIWREEGVRFYESVAEVD